MATLKEFFETDFSDMAHERKETKLNSSDGQIYEIFPRLHQNFFAGCTYLSCYLPAGSCRLDLADAVIQNTAHFLKFGDGVGILSGLPGELPISSDSLKFTGRLFLYHESEFEAATDALYARATVRGITLQLRGPQFAKERTAIEKPLAFISHDSRDKDEIARPLAHELIRLRCPVWYDEYSLKVGDRLRQSIERGLSECSKCVLIITPNFINNKGWTKAEFESVYNMEITYGRDIFLPVWHGVSPQDVSEYCRLLPDRIAAQWSDGLGEVAKRLYAAVRA